MGLALGPGFLHDNPEIDTSKMSCLRYVMLIKLSKGETCMANFIPPTNGANRRHSSMVSAPLGGPGFESRKREKIINSE